MSPPTADRRRTVGVLGGMGPAATLDFLHRLLAATPAACDADHLRILVDCNPQVPDRNRAAAGTGPSPGPVLAAMARGLARQGADLLAMPCNAAHGWTADIRAAVTIPLVSMIEETAAAVARDHPRARRVGLLAVDATRAAGLYQPHLPAPVLLGEADQARFMATIGRVKAGERGDGVTAAMTALAATLVAGGAELVVAACTEVPLVLPAGALVVPLLDPAAILAERVAALAGAGSSQRNAC